MAQTPRKALFVESRPIAVIDGKPIYPSRDFLLGLQKITDLIGGSQGFLPETIADGTVYGIVYVGPNGGLTSTAAPTDGQVLIGDTDAAPVLATLTGTPNRVTVTNAAGSITLSAPQDLHSGASPTFVAETLSGGTASKIVWLDANKKTTTTGANQTANLVYAGPSSGAAAEPAFRALVLADLPTQSQTAVKRKTADESVTSSTTLQDDDHLTFAIAANEEWVATIELDCGAALATTGLKVAVTTPAAATQNIAASLASDVNTAANRHFRRTTTSGAALDFTAATLVGVGDAGVKLSVWVLNGANAGSVTLQFAQSTSSGTAVTLRKGSYLTASRIA